MADEKTWKDHCWDNPDCGCADICAHFIEEKKTCRRCRTELRDRNARNVGYCLPCYAEMMSDDDEIED